MLACEDSDPDCTCVSDDKLSVEEIHALQRRLKMGISFRNLRLQQLSHLLTERRRAEQVSQQVSQDLKNQALLQEASAADTHQRLLEEAEANAGQQQLNYTHEGASLNERCFSKALTRRDFLCR